MKTEAQIQRELVSYIRSAYPNTWLIANPQSRKKKAVHLRKLDVREGFESKQPDIIINRVVTFKGKVYLGLLLELKKDKTRIYKKDGSFSSTSIKGQFEYMENHGSNYFKYFGVGYDMAKEIIDDFFSLKVFEVNEK